MKPTSNTTLLIMNLAHFWRNPPCKDPLINHVHQEYGKDRTEFQGLHLIVFQGITWKFLSHEFNLKKKKLISIPFSNDAAVFQDTFIPSLRAFQEICICFVFQVGGHTWWWLPSSKRWDWWLRDKKKLNKGNRHKNIKDPASEKIRTKQDKKIKKKSIKKQESK